MQDNNRKLMFLLDSYHSPYAGTERQLYLLVSGLMRAGLEVELTLLRHSDYIAEQGFPCKVNVLNITRLLSLNAVMKMFSFANKMRKNNFSPVHIFFNDASIIAPIILKLHGLKVLISRRDMGFWYNRLNTLLLKINSFFVDAVVANSEAVKQITHEREGMALQKIAVIYNGYDDLLRPADADEEPARHPQANTPAITIGLIANIRPIKRIDVLIAAFALLQEKYPQAQLQIVGGGDAQPLQAQAADLGIQARVHFLGARSDTGTLLKQFDVAVLCSESEGFSNAIIEYIQAGVPVVCTNVGGNPEIIEHGKTGYLVPVGDAQELADKIAMLLDDPLKAGEMTEEARTRIAALCDYNMMIEKHLALYAQVQPL